MDHSNSSPQRTQRNAEEEKILSVLLCVPAASSAVQNKSMELNRISGAVVDSAMKVHTALGAGLLESAYEVCLIYELRKRGFKIQSQQTLPVVYDGLRLDAGRGNLTVRGICYRSGRCRRDALIGLSRQYNLQHDPVLRDQHRVSGRFRSSASVQWFVSYRSL